MTSSAALVSAYPDTSHSMAAALARRSRWMVGRATLTTKKSRTKTKVPQRMTASGAHLAKRETGPASALALLGCQWS